MLLLENLNWRRWPYIFIGRRWSKCLEFDFNYFNKRQILMIILIMSIALPYELCMVNTLSTLVLKYNEVFKIFQATVGNFTNSLLWMPGSIIAT